MLVLSKRAQPGCSRKLLPETLMPGAASAAVQRCFAFVQLSHTLHIAADMGSLRYFKKGRSLDALKSSCLRNSCQVLLLVLIESCFACMQGHRLKPRHTVSHIIINACRSKEGKKKHFCERTPLLCCILTVGSTLAVQHSSCFLTECESS